MNDKTVVLLTVIITLVIWFVMAYKYYQKHKDWVKDKLLLATGVLIVVFMGVFAIVKLYRFIVRISKNSFQDNMNGLWDNLSHQYVLMGMVVLVAILISAEYISEKKKDKK